MSILSITAASFVPSANAVYESFVAGATLTRGQPYYLDSAASYVAKAGVATSQAAARIRGISASDVAVGQRGLGVIRDPALAIGATTTKGVPYYLDDTAGGIATYDELGTGDYVTFLGLGNTGNLVNFDPLICDEALA